MRIIRVLMALGIAFGLFILAPKVSLAADAEDSNETKINFEINDNIKVENGVMKDRLLALAPYNFSGYTPVKSERDIEIEKMMAKYEPKRAKASYPRGKFTINASAYTAAADECGKSDGITASGLKVREGETIACPPMFPFGTKISIEGMGTYICEDRGGAIKGNKIDIYVEKKSDAFAFGRRMLLAEVIQ